MSPDGVLNNVLSWGPPNNYMPGDLLVHFAGPSKNMVHTYAERAFSC